MTPAARRLVSLLVGVIALAAPAVVRASALSPMEIVLDGHRELVGIAVDGQGTVYVADRKAGSVLRLATSGVLTTVASGLDHPAGVAIDGDGRLLVAEQHAGRVVRIETSGQVTTLVTGLQAPRWLAPAPDGSIYVSAHDGTAKGGDADEADVIVRWDPAGGTAVVATNLRKLEGLVLNGVALYASAKRVKTLANADGVIVRYPVHADGGLGSAQYFMSVGLKDPAGLALDRLGAMWITTKQLTLTGLKSGPSVAKAHPDGRLTSFADLVRDGQGVAFAPDGSLYVADGNAGRVLRFQAPPAPVLDALPEFTNQTPLTVADTTEGGARLDFFVNDGGVPIRTTATDAGRFEVTLPLASSSRNRIEVFATAVGGDGLTSAAFEGFVTHDSLAPAVRFTLPLTLAHLRRTVTVEARAEDDGSGIASITLIAAGQNLEVVTTPTLPAPSTTASASWDTTATADGVQQITAAATDRAGNTSTVSRNVVVDNTTPDTEIIGGPADEVLERTVTFTFTGIDNLTPAANLVFAWRLDGGPLSAFDPSTSATLADLAEGPHTFEVIARDLAGNEDATPATRDFRIRLAPAITAVNPTSGTAGAFVTIAGHRFLPGPTSVTFNGVPAVVRTLTATAVTTTVPIGAASGLVAITTPSGKGMHPFTVTTTGEFTLTASPGVGRTIAGDQTSIAVAAAGSGSFSSLVRLSVSGGAAGITPSLAPALVAPGGIAFITLSIAPTVAPGMYGFTVNGEADVDGRTTTRAATFSVEVLPPGARAVTGRVLTTDAVPQPIPGATVALGTAFTLSDAGGNFVLLEPPTGANMLLVDGRTASTATAQYPPVEINIDVQAAGATRLPFIVYLPRLDTANPIQLPIDSSGRVTRTTEATTPSIPGLVVTIPAGTLITGPDGSPVTEITITPVPVDRSPMPFPPGVAPASLFTIQPGGAVPSQPLPISFPNTRPIEPGTRGDLYYFDLATGNWQVWGTGTTSADSTRIVSDPGFGLPRFAWHFVVFFQFDPQRPPDQTNPWHPKAVDPVDLVTGRFTIRKTDLTLPGRSTVHIDRQYRSEDVRPGLFGRGWNLAPYDSILTTLGASWELTLPDRSSHVMAPIGPGRWANSSAPFLRGATLMQLSNNLDFTLRFKDGTVHRFARLGQFANAAGLVAVADRNGNTINIQRDGSGRIVRITDPVGRALVFTSDAVGRITTITDPIGRVVRYGYDGLGRLVSATDPAGGTTHYTYDASHRILTITDARGSTYLTNEYDASGRVVRQTQADGGTWILRYAARVHACSSLGNGVETSPSFAILPEGTVCVVTGGFEGRIVTLENQETTLTDPRGQSTTYRFDGMGFPLSMTDPLGQTTAYDYEPGSNLLSATTDSLGRVTRFTYDAVGNVTSVTDAAGNQRIFTYESAFSRITSITDSLGQVTRFAYDARGNLASMIDRIGKTTTFTHDAFGQLITVSDPLGNTSALTYDASGNLAAIANPLGSPTTFEYDAVGRLVRQTDARGYPTTFEHDPLNRVTTVTDALQGITRFSFDANGNLMSATDARGNTITQTYDSMDRVTTRIDQLGAGESFAYDLAGNLTQRSDRKRQISSFLYDSLNRLTNTAYADGSGLSLTYDAAGRIVRVEDSVGGTLTNTYDVLDRLLGQATGLGMVSYQYDSVGRRIQLDVPGTAPVTYSYDAASRLIQILKGTQAVSFEYDDAGRRTQLTLPNGVSTEYQYDRASQIKSYIYRNVTSLLGTLTYEYDAAGNRTQVGGTFARTLLPRQVAAAAYDGANRQLAFGDAHMTFDANGNLATIVETSGATVLSWDARDRLMSLEGRGVLAAFAYDAFGRRLRKTINGAVREFLYDGLDVAQQLETSAAISYLRSLAIDEMLGFANSESEFFSIADGLGSTVGITDSSGRLLTAYSYDAFGATEETNFVVPNAVQYTGRENDETGLYFYRARYYSPGLSRFISEDPLRGAHEYAYVGNNPLRSVDPMGFAAVPAPFIPPWAPPGGEPPPGDECDLIQDPELRMKCSALKEGEKVRERSEEYCDLHPDAAICKSQPGPPDPLTCAVFPDRPECRRPQPRPLPSTGEVCLIFPQSPGCSGPRRRPPPSITEVCLVLPNSPLCQTPPKKK